MNLSIDQLFEQRSIGDIDQVHKKLQNEIEEKKMELRTLVGERYRDLIKAADTIADMKNTAASVIVHVDKITNLCTTFHEQQLMGFKGEVQQPFHRKHSINTNLYSIAIQIKILTSLPELIWTNLDRENYLVATQLFILSRHISTGLQLDSNMEIMKKFPVVKKQWAFILSPFYFTIKNSCVATMEREDITAAVASSCLASLMLLENCDIDKLLTMFIQMRCKAYVNILCDDNVKYEKVKDKLLASVKVLIQTVELLHEVFIDNGSGAGSLTVLIEGLANAKSKPTICLLEHEEQNIIRSLPDIITKYRPQIKISALKSTTLQSTMSSWLQYIENISQNQLKRLIQLIASVKVIHGIKKQANALVKASDWNQFCQKLLLPNELDFYKNFYQHLINIRIKDIIRTSWQDTIDETQKDVEQLLNQRYEQFNIYKHVWTEEATDNPKSLQEVMQRGKSASKLLMKTKGYEPAIVELFQKMDGKIEALYNDLSIYLKNDELYQQKGVTVKQDELVENESIVAYLKDCSRECISEFITNIKSSNFKPTPENHILLARLLKACTELCPNLKQCLLSHTLKVNWNISSSADFPSQSQNSEQWLGMCNLLEEESHRFWRLWLDQFIQKWQTECKSELCLDNDLKNMLNIYLNWEIITIEEKDEQDNAVQSTIRVPAQPSFPLQHCLDRVCLSLQELLPHTLPALVAQLLVDSITKQFYNFYQKLSEDETVKTNQNLALQYFFDLKWITLMLITRDSKVLLDQYTALIAIYKGFIDPFDFDVFYAHLNTNVKKSGQRMQFQIGCIIPSMDQLLGVLSGQQQVMASAVHEKDPNVLPLSSNATTVTWFPLLPLSMQQGDTVSVQPSASDLQQLEKERNISQQTTTTPRSKVKGTSSRERSQPKSGAAAFFGAMSQDWFK